jgi:hypothetical protein
VNDESRITATSGSPIRQLVQPIIDELYELYDDTDPSKGESSEENKFQLAKHAMHLWWHVFGRLLLMSIVQLSRFQIDLWSSLRTPTEYPCDTHAVFCRQLLSEKRTIGIAKSSCEISRQTDN